MTRSGEYLDLPAELYHSDPAYGNSDLGLALKCPLIVRASKDGHAERAETSAFALGTALHCSVLEPTRFATTYRTAPDCDRRTKEGKAEYAAFLETCSESTVIIDRDDAVRVNEMSEAIDAHPFAGRLLRRSLVREASYFWQDEESGLPCKCRPDAIVDGSLLIDVKTTEDASPDAWRASAHRYGYARAVAHYTAGVHANIRHQLEGFVFVVVEKKAPYAVAVYQLDPAWIELGEMKRREALTTIAKATEAKRWPSYGEGRPMTLSAPKWAFSEVM